MLQPARLTLGLLSIELSERLMCTLNPGDLIPGLYSNSLLTRNENERAIQLTATPTQRLHEILRVLEQRILADSDDFHKILQIIKAEPVLDEVGHTIMG